MLVENDDKISEYFSMSTYEEVFLALATGVEHLFVGEIEQDRESAKAWLKRLCSHVEDYPSKLQEIERVALSLLDYFPSLRKSEDSSLSFLDSLLIDFLKKKLFEHHALDILLKLGANLTPVQAKPFREGLDLPELGFAGSRRYFFTDRFVFHLLMQPGLEDGREYIFHSRVVREFYKRLTEEEYCACYQRIFSKASSSPEVAKLAVIDYAEEKFSLTSPKPYEPVKSDCSQKETPLECAIKRGISHPLGLYEKLDKLVSQDHVAKREKLPLVLLYECFKDLPRVFEILLKLMIKTKTAEAYSGAPKTPSLFKLVSDAKDDMTMLTLESLDNAGWVHRAIRLNNVRELKKALSKKVTFEVESMFEEHYGMTLMSYALTLHSERSEMVQTLKVEGFVLPVSVSAMQIEQAASGKAPRDREKCIVM